MCSEKKVNARSEKRRNMTLPVFVDNAGDRKWRKEVHERPQWRPDADEIKHGPRTSFASGIYIVTVNEGTKSSWIDLAWRAAIAASKQHPGPTLLPSDNYDSAVAVLGGRVVGGALISIEAVTRYRWKVNLRPDGRAYIHKELFGPQSEQCGITFDPRLDTRPAIYTIRVHRAHRKRGIGRQLVRTVAGHYSLPVTELGFRLPLSKKAVQMVKALELTTIIACN
jgi:hypothetical protein